MSNINSDFFSESFENKNNISNKLIVTKVTMMWLNIWYRKMYENLGWIALSINEGRHQKATSYLHRLKELLANAEKKEKDTIDADKKEDVRILIKNVKKLIHFATYLFRNIHKRFSYDYEGIAKNRSFFALQKWHVKKFQKLGWIALLKSEGSKHEIKAYIHNIADLQASIEKKLEGLEDNDKIYDLKIVLNNVKHLRHYAQILLA